MKIKAIALNTIAAAAIMAMAACGTTKTITGTPAKPVTNAVADTEAARLNFVRSVSDRAVAQRNITA